MRMAYMNTFGKLITDLFALKISCIEKKKTIAYFQLMANQGKTVVFSEMKQYIETVMTEYRKQLDDMIKERENSKFDGQLTEMEALEIKKIHRDIAKKIHPDLNDFGDKSDEFNELWLQASIAYKLNDLEELKELEVLVNKALNDFGKSPSHINIADIDGKISALEKEIEQIKITDPYQYKFLLENSEAVNEKKQEIADEIEEYKEYEKQLFQILRQLSENGVEL